MDRERERQFNERNIAEFRSSGGRLSTFGDAPVLLLTTTGSSTGLPRVNPMMYLADDDDPAKVYVFASAAGADKNPAWFGNIVANPKGLTVEIERKTLQADAEVLSEPARSRKFDVQADLYPGFASYQAMTSRVIPVIALTLHR